MDMERRKKMKTSGFSCQSLQDLSRDALILVLIRLPIKQLLLCMLVSKILCSFICQPEFMQAYCIHNPCWIITSVRNKHVENGNISSFGRSFYCSDSHMEFFNMLNLSSRDINTKLGKIMLNGDITQIINGLVCWYFKKWVVLVNVFTGELTELPSPNIHPNSKPRYYFVYHPINRVYKLLCAKRVGISSVEFHILRIGANGQDLSSWRKISQPEDYFPSNFLRQGILVDGTLYWLLVDHNSHEHKVLAFDPTTEKFRSFVPGYGDYRVFNCLVQVNGKLSLLARCRRMVVVHIIKMDDNDSPEDWSISIGSLASGFQGHLVPIGNSLTGDLLLADAKATGSSITPIYVYNHQTQKLVKYANGKFPQGLECNTDGPSLMAVVEHNIQMLDALINRFRPRY